MLEMAITLLVAFTITFVGSIYLLTRHMPSKHTPLFLSILLTFFSYTGWVFAGSYEFGQVWFHAGLVILISCMLTGLSSFFWWIRTIMIE